ncbi:uncharacterized protein LOC112087842 [Eutrema salsugineum]|uniref:uncharacterized protein LOC112087842 n=1 Tax=Eutrema salsugineum TaxID=72664 RepID=UPI000CED1387|nr:uncharacterized protein LOC112087842 [Eutrema salsugineum]
MDRPKALVKNTHLDEDDEEIIELPHVDNSHLIARFSRSLVGRMFNTEIRSTEALISFMPRHNIWDVEGRVHGIDLGNSRFQFNFDSEADLLKVLSKRPCHFTKWSFSLERWIPHVGEYFPNNMTFWIWISGIPTHFWLKENFEAIGSRLGRVTAVDARAARVQVSLNADEPLKFAAKARLQSGELVRVEMKYERLDRWCLTCRHISYDERSCPLLSEDQRKENMKEREAERNLNQTLREDLIRDRDILHLCRQAGQISAPTRERAPAANHLAENRSILIPANEERAGEKDRRDPRDTEVRKNDDNRSASVWNRLEPSRDYRSEARHFERRYVPEEEQIYRGRDHPHQAENVYRKRRYEESFANSKRKWKKKKK